MIQSLGHLAGRFLLAFPGHFQGTGPATGRSWRRSERLDVYKQHLEVVLIVGLVEHLVAPGADLDAFESCRLDEIPVVREEEHATTATEIVQRPTCGQLTRLGLRNTDPLYLPSTSLSGTKS